MEVSCKCPESLKGSLPEELLKHVKYGEMDEIQEWLSSGGNINAATEGGQTLLSAACVYKQPEILEKLIEDPCIHLNTKHRLGTLNLFTPLCIAAYKGLQDCVTVLLKSSCQCRLDLQAKTSKGKTALMLAAEKNHWEIVEMLCPSMSIPEEDINVVASLARLSKKSNVLSYIQGIISNEKQENAVDEENSRPASERVYSNNTKPRGHVLILNYKFENDPDSVRKGTDADAAKLHRVFQIMGYKTEELPDLTKEDTITSIKEFCNQECLKDISSVIVVVLTHGRNRDTFATADHKFITMNQLLRHFTDLNCPFMRGKPKIFLLQFCRGQDMASQVNCTGETRTTDSQVNLLDDAIEAFTDMLCIYSSQEDFKSYRLTGNPSDPFTGTPFIEAFSRVLEEKGHMWLDDLIREFIDEYSNILGGQPMDCQNFCFRKKFCFNPSP
ncbi:hypothetical protein SK128_014203 [Halocaridina rubra]|uniref:Caspase family p20 domain-containing protein n=1 Tax=Halocaridina rubra TaxID=373956 RepID=A0AAN9A2E2_HALRR